MTLDQQTSSQSVCDLDSALHAVDDDRALLSRMIHLFIMQSPNLLQEIRAAVECRDGVALWRAAHTLRGSVCNFGAHRANDGAARLEQIGRDRNWSAAAEAHEDLQKAMVDLDRALAEFSKDPAP